MNSQSMYVALTPIALIYIHPDRTDANGGEMCLLKDKRMDILWGLLAHVFLPKPTVPLVGSPNTA